MSTQLPLNSAQNWGSFSGEWEHRSGIGKAADEESGSGTGVIITVELEVESLLGEWMARWEDCVRYFSIRLVDLFFSAFESTED